MKQAAILTYNNLVANLSQHHYEPIPHTVGLWRHSTRSIIFYLCVDNFGICYQNADDANHILSALQTHYRTSVDWSGIQFCGLHLAWDYPNKHVTVSSMLSHIFLTSSKNSIIIPTSHSIYLIPQHHFHHRLQVNANMPCLRISHPPSTTTKKQESKALLDLSCTTQERSTAPFYQH